MSRSRAPAGVRPEPAAEWAGLLPVDKPRGITSHDVVARARRRLGTRAIGHLGTLDPAAGGLLVLAIGAATRCAGVWQGGRKTYEGTACFGVVTDSQDLEGQVIERRDASGVRPDAIRRASEALTGDLLQVPPMVSALKHRGERLHAIARRGESVERAPRAIHVESWVWHSYEPAAARFEVRCSGGTYVRTLVHDLGAALGAGAALAELRRTASEPFRLEQAVTWAALNEQPREQVLERHGIELGEALRSLPEVVLEPPQVRALGFGQSVPLARAWPGGETGSRAVVLRDAGGRALALGGIQRDERGGWRAKPDVVFPWTLEGAPRP